MIECVIRTENQEIYETARKKKGKRPTNNVLQTKMQLRSREGSF